MILPLAAMTIAVNTRFLLKTELEGCGYFIREVFLPMARNQPEHQFYFLFDRPYDSSFEFPGNVHPVIVPPPARLPVLWKYWYDIKIPLVLKKIKADVFVSPDGFCSLYTSVPQCLLIHDLGFLHYPETYRASHVRYLKRYTSKFLKKAKTIITVSEFSKRDIIEQYKTPSEKINIVYNAVRKGFRELNFEEQAAVKEKYTEGKEFFIYTGAIHPRKNLINLLKAFSVFKKRLQSSMKLVLAGRLAWKNDEFLSLLKTYKYRDDVVLTGYLPEAQLSLLLGSSYALVYPSLFEGFGVPVIEAMKCGVPPLASKNTSMEEIGGEGTLYFDAQDYIDIAEKMMRIYKDESLRNELIKKGKEVVKNYDWNGSAQRFWAAIISAIGE